MKVYSHLKPFVPPVLADAARRTFRVGMRYDGPFDRWDVAVQASGGYSTDLILERVVHATREVVAGRAAFERDSALFEAPQHRFSLLAGLLHAAALARGRLHVIDFGGALGSVYWQYRALLTGLPDLRWVVVEQPSFVEAGRCEFAGGPLAFETDFDAAAAQLASPLILASSVLQYVREPETTLRLFAGCGAACLILDRTPISEEETHNVCVQHVPREIYPASYPSWVFARKRLFGDLARRWRVVWELPCDEPRVRSSNGLSFGFNGYYLQASR